MGRVAAAAQERELPSGDVVSTWRVVVDRPPPTRTDRGRPVLVDTLDCAAWAAGVRRRCARLEPGDVVEVQGAAPQVLAGGQLDGQPVRGRGVGRAPPPIRSCRGRGPRSASAACGDRTGARGVGAGDAGDRMGARGVGARGVGAGDVGDRIGARGVGARGAGGNAAPAERPL